MAVGNAMAPTHQILGRIFVTGEIHVVTGLHIGGAPAGLVIGGVDNPVIRDPLTNRPYVPGSSLRGKMRSLGEKIGHLEQNWEIGQQVRIHSCETNERYQACDHCQVYGVLGSVRGQTDFGGPTRLIVRDVPLTDESARELERVRTDLPFTEVKWEAAIDRVTAAATPRQLERVPAGAVFAPLELIYTVYDARDPARFLRVIEALRWVEDDYLGGLGARGSGKVVFANVRVNCRTQREYAVRHSYADGEGTDVDALLEDREGLLRWLEGHLLVGGR